MEGRSTLRKLLATAESEGYRFGGRAALTIVNQSDAVIGAAICEDGHDGLRLVGEWRAALNSGADPTDIAKAALIMLECYSQILIERGLSMSRSGHVAEA